MIEIKGDHVYVTGPCWKVDPHCIGVGCGATVRVPLEEWHQEWQVLMRQRDGLADAMRQIKAILSTVYVESQALTVASAALAALEGDAE